MPRPCTFGSPILLAALLLLTPAAHCDTAAHWSYLGTADIELPPGIGGAEPTHWAPDIVTDSTGLHHLFLTGVPGVFANWNHPRTIVHLTSTDLRAWRYAQPLALRRSSIQVVELHEQDGRLTCDRGAPTYVRLSSPSP